MTRIAITWPGASRMSTRLGFCLALMFGTVEPVRSFPAPLPGVVSIFPDFIQPGGPRTVPPEFVFRIQSTTGGPQQQQGPSRDGRTGRDRGRDHGGGIFTFLNTRDTNRLTDQIAATIQSCDSELLDRRYRIDCIRLHFLKLARELPSTGEYLPVKLALTRAATDLEAIVRRNLDPRAPALRPTVNGRAVAPDLPPLRAVRRTAEDRALRAATAVVEETATVLLRSAENSERRKVHFQQIAAAINSTKVLLRST